MTDTKQKRLVIIDSNALIHRAYHALPRFMTRKGELTNAIYGFSAVLIKVLKELKPDYIAAAFDVQAPTFRDKEYREYKAKRVKAPDDLYAQIPRVKEVLVSLGIPIYEHAGFEADDVIGTIVAQAPKKQPLQDMEIIIVTGDLDALQLVRENVKVYTLRKGIQDTVLYGIKEVAERFGLRPEQLIDYKALRGDPSDNIIGVPGVGEKTASELLQKFDTLENLYGQLELGKAEGIKPRVLKLLTEHKDDAFFSKMLATIRLDAPIQFSLKDARFALGDLKDVSRLFTELEFSSLLKRLESIHSGGGSGQPDEAVAHVSPTPDPVPKAEDSQDGTGAPLGELDRLFQEGVLSAEVYQLEKELMPVIAQMEKRGIRVDKKALLVLQKKTSEALRKLEKKIHKDARKPFNINSSQQLSVVLFEELKISSRGIGKTPGGELSTAAPELEKLSGAHPIIESILQYRELQKLLSTYILPLPLALDKESRVHTTFHQFGTTTGRLSSSDPNMQNIPTRSPLGQEVREAFIPSEGMLFLSADYSQMELRVVASLARDSKMLHAFSAGEDIHVYTAAKIFDVPEKDVTKEMRYRAKTLNFGLIYGIGIRAFARSAGLDMAAAKDFMRKYMEIFSGIALYMENVKKFAHTHGYVETLWGRKRFLPDINSTDPRVRRAEERAAINMPVQGTAADIVKRAMVVTAKKLPELTLLLQVHDELLWEAPADTIKKYALSAGKILEEAGGPSIPLKVDLRTGESWSDLEPLV